MLNSRHGSFTAPGIESRDPFFRSYGASVPSSLTRFHSRALVFAYHSTCVGFGTDEQAVTTGLFSAAWRRCAESGRTLHPGNPMTPAEPSSANLSIDYAFRPCLRIRLTPGGRTCPGKPWNSGGRDSHPAFRYSCPHNRLHAVHGGLRPRFEPHATLPYRPPLRAILQLRHRAYSRSFSARGLSTSQLLRNV